MHPEKPLVISVEQSGGNGGEGMMLSIHQPFGQAFKYRAQVMDSDVPGSVNQASTYPVVPNSDGYETSPEPITLVMVGEFHLIDSGSGNTSTCSY